MRRGDSETSHFHREVLCDKTNPLKGEREVRCIPKKREKTLSDFPSAQERGFLSEAKRKGKIPEEARDPVFREISFKTRKNPGHKTIP